MWAGSYGYTIGYCNPYYHSNGDLDSNGYIYANSYGNSFFYTLRSDTNEYAYSHAFGHVYSKRNRYSVVHTLRFMQRRF